MYKLPVPIEGKTPDLIIRLSDNAFIPMDEQNSDYAEYLKWVAEGNEPLPPDSQE
jgi:hypothetical protein